MTISSYPEHSMKMTTKRVSAVVLLTSAIAHPLAQANTGDASAMRDITSVLALLVSLASFVIAQRSAMKAKKKEAITFLLGEKETVIYAALKLLRDGLPNEAKERKVVISALLQACILEGSDRARAVLYAVVEKNREDLGVELRETFMSMRETYRSMRAYNFTKEELDLSRAFIRLNSLGRVLRVPPEPNM